VKKVIFALSILFCNYTFAGVIYDESVNGDSPIWWNSGGADLGVVADDDIVLGFTNYAAGNYWDGYLFTLNGTMDQITITAESGNYVHNGWQLYTGNSVLLSDTLNFIGDSLVFDVSGLSGVYSLGNNGIGGTTDYDYSIVFNGVAVPEPFTLLLLTAGLAGLGVTSRKKPQA
jgi:hypothetical protein